MKSAVVGALFALAGFALAYEEDAQAQVQAQAQAQEVLETSGDGDEYNLDDYVCDSGNYEIYLFSHDPLVIYITNFVSPFERQHLQRITNGTFARSNVATGEGDVVSEYRTSHSTTVNPDKVTECIKERAQRFQGLDLPVANVEPIQLVQYAEGQQYNFHTDWFPDSATSPGGHADVARGGNRETSFFTYVSVSDDIAGGGTAFPQLQAPKGEKWCRFIECDDEWAKGVTFRAVEGNAVFWTNLVDGPDGKRVGDERVLHAGLPVIKGSKLGMNIWTKQGIFT